MSNDRKAIAAATYALGVVVLCVGIGSATSTTVADIVFGAICLITALAIVSNAKT